MSGLPATAETMPLVSAAAALIALSNASGPSSTPPRIWPRSAILQSAAASSVDGIRALTVSTADSKATFGRVDAKGDREVDRVLHDVDLVLEAGRDVDGAVGEDQRPG